jgi:hypothetical protein
MSTLQTATDQHRVQTVFLKLSSSDITHLGLRLGLEIMFEHRRAALQSMLTDWEWLLPNSARGHLRAVHDLELGIA